MFEKAVRMKLRFDFRGQISVEDLWDLHVQELDSIYSVLMAQQKAISEDSLLNQPTQENQTRDLRIDLIKHVVEVKLAEQEAKRDRATKKMQKDKIASIIAKKQDEDLESMSITDLQKAMEELS